MNLELELRITVDVEYKFIPGSDDYFDSKFGNYLPGDPPRIEIIKVTVPGETPLDIKNNICDLEMMDLEQSLLDYHESI